MRWRNRAHAGAVLVALIVADLVVQVAAWTMLPAAVALAVAMVATLGLIVGARLITSTYRAHGWA